MEFLHNIVEVVGAPSFWMKALELMLALSLLVIVHEFGHYSFARLFGIWVEKFYMFFNPKISLLRWDPRRHDLRLLRANPQETTATDKAAEQPADKAADQTIDQPALTGTWRDTVYGIGWVPLGGYCKIAGMIDESMDVEQMRQPAKPYEFRSKPAWQRLLVMIGGVLFNFLLAVVIYSGIVYTYGDMTITYADATEGMEYCPAAKAIGFVDGDIPLSADDKPLVSPSDDNTMSLLTAHVIKVLRNNTDTIAINLPDDFVFQVEADAKNGIPLMTYRVPVVVLQTMARSGAEHAGILAGDRLVAVDNKETPVYRDFVAALAEHKNSTVDITVLRNGQRINLPTAIDNTGKIGVHLSDITKIFHTTVKHYNLLQCVPRGLELGWDKMVSYVKSLKLLFTNDGAQSLGGFGAIGSIFPEQWNWLSFWDITALLSIILAVMNILPIPALDGGHVMFLLYEMVTGRKPGEKFLERAQTVGMLLLFALLLYANGNDVYRFFIK